MARRALHRLGRGLLGDPAELLGRLLRRITLGRVTGGVAIDEVALPLPPFPPRFPVLAIVSVAPALAALLAGPALGVLTVAATEQAFHLASHLRASR